MARSGTAVNFWVALKVVLEVVSDTTKALARYSSIAAILVLPMWALAKPLIEPRVAAYTNLPSQFARLEARQTEMYDGLNVMGQNLATLVRQFEQSKPGPSILDFDRSATRILTGKCYISEVCFGSIRVKRTQVGAGCGYPTANHYVSNHFGDEYGVEAAAKVGGRLSDTSWRVIDFSFKVPSSVRAGTGSFYIRFQYPDCPFAEVGALVLEQSPDMPLIFLEKSPG